MTRPSTPIAYLRACAAADALLAARARLVEEGSDADRAAAEFIAGQILRADDETARGDDLVSQGDG